MADHFVGPRWTEPARHPDLVPYAGRDASVIAALLHHEATSGRAPTYGDLMTATRCTRSELRGSLHRLRAAGLVTWVEGQQGTIRSCVAVVVPSLSA